MPFSPEGGTFLCILLRISSKKRNFARKFSILTMSQEEYNNIDWQRGNIVRLTNGKEYPVKKPKKKYLLLYSAEHESYFVARSASRRVTLAPARTAHYRLPYFRQCGPYPEKKVAEVKPEHCLLPPSNLPPEPAPAPVAEAKPKRKRQRITIKGTSVEKIVF